MALEEGSDLKYLIKLHKDHPLQSPPTSAVELRHEHECPSCEQFKLKMIELEKRIEALEGKKRKGESDRKMDKGYQSEEQQQESLLQPNDDYRAVSKQLFTLPKSTAAKESYQKHNHHHSNKENSNQANNKYVSHFSDEEIKPLPHSQSQKQMQTYQNYNPSIYYEIEMLKQHLLQTYPDIKVEELEWERDPLLISPFRRLECPQPYPHLQNQNAELRKRMLRYRRQLQNALKQIGHIKRKILDCSCPCIQSDPQEWLST